jgi:surface antigen
MKKQWIAGSLIAVTAMQTSLPAQADRATTGGLLGAAAGALIGNQVGNGNGRIAATILGAVAGSVIGSTVGRNMDEADRRAFNEAQSYCLNEGPGVSRRWNGSTYGSRTHAQGTFRTLREGTNSRTGETCREYKSEIYIGGQVETSSGIACVREDGSYYEANQRYVRFNDVQETDSGYVTPGYHYDYSHGRRHHDIDDEIIDSRVYNSQTELTGSMLPPPPPPSTVPAPAPLPPQAPRFEVTRMMGGEWYRVTYTTPVTITGLRLLVQGTGVRVYETAIVTAEGSRIPVPQISNTGVIRPTLQPGAQLPAATRIYAIDIRAESFGGLSAIMVYPMFNEVAPPYVTSNF